MTAITIARWTDTAPPDTAQLRRVEQREGHSFVARTHREWLDGSNRFDQVGEGFFLALHASLTVGMCGLNRDPFLDDPAIGRLRHLYVAPDYRRQGIGRRLVMACLELATDHFTRVRLRTFDARAVCFYELLGFTPVAEDNATHEWRAGGWRT